MQSSYWPTGPSVSMIPKGTKTNFGHSLLHWRRVVVEPQTRVSRRCRLLDHRFGRSIRTARYAVDKVREFKNEAEWKRIPLMTKPHPLGSAKSEWPLKRLMCPALWNRPSMECIQRPVFPGLTGKFPSRTSKDKGPDYSLTIPLSGRIDV